MNPLSERPFEREIYYRTSRSSGPGGQHVNKTESKVELIFNVLQSELLSDEEKKRFETRMGHRLTQEGELQIQAAEYRSQHKNKEDALAKFFGILQEGLKKPRKRIPTRPTKASKQKRLERKRMLAEKKSSRRKNNWF